MENGDRQKRPKVYIVDATVLGGKHATFKSFWPPPRRQVSELPQGAPKASHLFAPFCPKRRPCRNEHRYLGASRLHVLLTDFPRLRPRQISHEIARKEHKRFQKPEAGTGKVSELPWRAFPRNALVPFDSRGQGKPHMHPLPLLRLLQPDRVD